MKAWLNSLLTDATPSIDECVSMLGVAIGWLNQLKQIPQDPEWHAEGDVHIHTGMVLDELYKLLDGDAAHIQGWQRQALILGALLHDVGKTQRTKELEIKGIIRVASPQHEAVGRSYLAFKLMALDLPFSVVWTVLGLVGEHHMPKLLIVKSKDKADYIALSRRANCELLYWLEVADMKGRICPDVGQQLSYLEEFRMFSEEYKVWDRGFYPHELRPLLANETRKAQEYITANAIRCLQNGSITMAEEAEGKFYAHKNKHSHLVVLCGPSGIGKSSFVAKYYADFALVSLDEIRAEVNGCRTSQKNRGQVIHLAKDRLKACLRSHKNVVWDATNLRSDFRKIVCDLGRDYHALVSIVVFLAAEKEVINGNANREYPVPSDVLMSQLDSYQFPLVGEAHHYTIIGRHSTVLLETGGYKAVYQPNYELHYEC